GANRCLPEVDDPLKQYGLVFLWFGKRCDLPVSNPPRYTGIPDFPARRCDNPGIESSDRIPAMDFPVISTLQVETTSLVRWLATMAATIAIHRAPATYRLHWQTRLSSIGQGLRMANHSCSGFPKVHPPRWHGSVFPDQS